MKRFLLALFFASAIAPVLRGSDFFFDSSLGYVFDNHEFAYSSDKYIPSETIHFGRITPYVGWNCLSGETLSARMVLGVDLIKQAGTQVSTISGILADVPLYLMLSYRENAQQVLGIAGSYPRNLLRGEYGEVIISEETVETDFNLDGMFLGYRKGDFYCETALDWMGKKSQSSHERFQILSYGRWSASRSFSLGWSGSFYHFAGSVDAPGVVDNHIFRPFVKLDVAPYLPLEEASLKLCGLASYQKERRSNDLRLPFGGEAELTLRKGNFGLNNLSSLTKDFLPFYSYQDAAGQAYGTVLYRGSLFYRKGFYDRVEMWWSPRLFWKLNFKLSMRLHFNSADGFLGWEQRVGLYYGF